MKKIQDLNIWVNGVNKVANTFYLILINDNLKDTAVFNYHLYNEFIDENGKTQLESIAMNSLTLTGQDYTDWGNTSDINTDAYTKCAQKLGLTIITN